MSVSLTKSPSIPARDSAGLYVLLPGDRDPFLVFSANPHPDIAEHVTVHGTFPPQGSYPAAFFLTLPAGQALPVLPG
jgi:hypothetical protein